MGDYALTKRADADLFEIFLFGCEQFGSKQAETYAGELERTFRRLANNPGMGRKAENIARGVRRHEVGVHVILYEDMAIACAFSRLCIARVSNGWLSDEPLQSRPAVRC